MADNVRHGVLAVPSSFDQGQVVLRVYFCMITKRFWASAGPRDCPNYAAPHNTLIRECYVHSYTEARTRRDEIINWHTEDRYDGR